MAIIATIVVGLIVGLIAKFLMPGKDPGGWIVTILIGIAGATAGTLIGRALGLYEPGESAGWIISILGAVLLLWIYRLVRGVARLPPEPCLVRSLETRSW